MNVCKDYHKHIHLDCTFGPKFKPDASMCNKNVMEDFKQEKYQKK